MNTSNSFESSNLWGPGTLPAVKFGGMEGKKRTGRERRLEVQREKKAKQILFRWQRAAKRASESD